LEEDEINKLSESSQEQIYSYAYLDVYYKKYLLCGDDGRFFNHSKENNCDDSIPNQTITLKDILIGEELTVDYTKFYENIDKDYLKS
jgi:SET domain-containing protein